MHLGCPRDRPCKSFCQPALKWIVERDSRLRTTTKVQAFRRMSVLFTQVSIILFLYARILTLCNDLYSRRVPLGFTLPTLDTHTAQTDYWNRPIAISKFNTRSNFWATPFNGNSRIDPMSTRKRKIKSCPVDSRIVTSVGRVRGVTLTYSSAKPYAESVWHLHRPDYPLHQSETHLAHTLLAYTSMISDALISFDRIDMIFNIYLSFFTMSIQAVDFH